MRRNEFRWRLLKQALFQKKAKAVLILLALTVGASVVAALLNLQVDLKPRMNRELRDYGPNIVIQSKTSGTYLSADFLTRLRSSSMMNKVIAHTPQLFLPVQIQKRPVLMTVVDLQSYRKLYPSQEWILRPGVQESGAIFLGKRLAEKLRTSESSNIVIRVQDREITLPVGGSVESGESEDDQAFLSVALAERLGLTAKGYQSVLLSVLGDLQEVERELDSLTQQNPGVQYQAIRRIASAETNILQKISQLMGLVILLIFIILFFCIQTTVSAILLSRQSEIALLRVLGARRQQITGMFSLELLILGLFGGTGGYILGMIMAQVLGNLLFQSFITPSVLVLIVTILFALFLMMISSILPISRAVNREAALVLKEA